MGREDALIDNILTDGFTQLHVSESVLLPPGAGTVDSMGGAMTKKKKVSKKGKERKDVPVTAGEVEAPAHRTMRARRH